MLEILAEDKKLLKQEQVLRPVKCAERSKTPIEIIVTPQWFIKILDKKELLLQKAAECNWHPKYMQKRLEHWIEGLHWDWCISRQRYFGVPFPVWYSKRKGEEGKIIVATKEELPIDPKITAPKGYSLDEVDPDIDVMDTWATSSISPQLNSRAITQEYALDFDRHQKLFPADLRPQAHEIIRTWAFYTITKSLIHQNTIPWKNVMISGWVLATDKTKMSKSKGNTITPEQLIKDSGADVIRYWASTSKLGTDIAYSEQMFSIGKKLITKLWNASKFVYSHIKDHTPDNQIIHPTDQWLMSKLHLVTKRASIEMDNFEYCTARSIIEDFFWQDFCDSYLELIKVRVYDAENIDPEAKQQAISTLHHSLSIVLRLFAPFLPHITEEIQTLIYQQSSIHSQNIWPKYQEIFYNTETEKTGDLIVEILDTVRKFKTVQQLSLRHQIKTINVTSVDAAKRTNFTQGLLDDLKNAANAKNLYINNSGAVSTDTKHELTTENWKIEFYL